MIGKRNKSRRTKHTPAEILAAARVSKMRRRVAPLDAPTWNCAARQIRESLELTASAVAKAIGVSPSTLSAIERGADPMLSTARKLADFYGRSIDSLWPSRCERS